MKNQPKRRINSKINLFLFLLLVNIGCSMKKGEYMNWVVSDDSGLTKTVVERAFKVKLTKLPAEYMVLNSYPNLLEWQDSLLTEFGHLTYFQLTIEHIDGDLLVKQGNQDDFDRIMYFFSFKLKNDIFAKVNAKMFPCSLYHYERGGGLNNKITILMAFDLQEVDKKAVDVSVWLKELNFSKPILFSFEHVSQPKIEL